MDSRPDTYVHIGRVRELITRAVMELLDRGNHHDASKLESPEVEVFDQYRSKLDTTEHDSPQYHQQLREMGEALKHHYAVNRHHPEHFPEGIHGMNLIDLLELCCDWVAASERQGGDLEAYIRGGARERFGYGDEIERLLLETVRALGR